MRPTTNISCIKTKFPQDWCFIALKKKKTKMTFIHKEGTGPYRPCPGNMNLGLWFRVERCSEWKQAYVEHEEGKRFSFTANASLFSRQYFKTKYERQREGGKGIQTQFWKITNPAGTKKDVEQRQFAQWVKTQWQYFTQCDGFHWALKNNCHHLVYCCEETLSTA